MYDLRNYPLVILLLTFVGLWFCIKWGAIVQRAQRNLTEDDRSDLSTIETATLTLLGLIIAFTFSMAVSRYDQRKNLEAEEANSIGTEYVRADLLPAEQADKLRSSLQRYLQQRILCYETREFHQGKLDRIEKTTVGVEKEMWSSATNGAKQLSGPTASLVIGGLNDVLNSRGYTQAAWSNRIPSAAWLLMTAIAGLCSFLVGYGAHVPFRFSMFVLPFAVSLSLFLIADIDSPHGGLIRVHPSNLTYLSESMAAH